MKNYFKMMTVAMVAFIWSCGQDETPQFIPEDTRFLVTLDSDASKNADGAFLVHDGQELVLNFEVLNCPGKLSGLDLTMDQQLGTLEGSNFDVLTGQSKGTFNVVYTAPYNIDESLNIAITISCEVTVEDGTTKVETVEFLEQVQVAFKENETTTTLSLDAAANHASGKAQTFSLTAVRSKDDIGDVSLSTKHGTLTLEPAAPNPNNGREITILGTWMPANSQATDTLTLQINGQQVAEEESYSFGFRICTLEADFALGTYDLRIESPELGADVLSKSFIEGAVSLETGATPTERYLNFTYDVFEQRVLLNLECGSIYIPRQEADIFRESRVFWETDTLPGSYQENNDRIITLNFHEITDKGANSLQDELTVARGLPGGGDEGTVQPFTLILTKQ